MKLLLGNTAESSIQKLVSGATTNVSAPQANQFGRFSSSLPENGCVFGMVRIISSVFDNCIRGIGEGVIVDMTAASVAGAMRDSCCVAGRIGAQLLIRTAINTGKPTYFLPLEPLLSYSE
jgi:hypothetical protein